jgi:hypothetical protein
MLPTLQASTMNKEPTSTSVVLAELCGADDFRSMKQLCAHTRLNVHRVSAALHHLHNRKCVAFISDAGGVWWYATPECDDRSRVVEQRAPELKPRKQRKGKKV